jgi:hypothetical protein
MATGRDGGVVVRSNLYQFLARDLLNQSCVGEIRARERSEWSRASRTGNSKILYQLVFALLGSSQRDRLTVRDAWSL